MNEARDYLIRQFDTAWKLASYHLDGLTTEECLWRPADAGLHVHRDDDGSWRADWPDRETYDIGPPSIAWLTWHMLIWWSIVLDHTLGAGSSVTRSRSNGPAARISFAKARTPAAAVAQRAHSARATTNCVRAKRTRWPFQQRPFGDVVAWATVELTKNAAEIGYARFLYARRTAESPHERSLTLAARSAPCLHLSTLIGCIFQHERAHTSVASVGQTRCEAGTQSLRSRLRIVDSGVTDSGTRQSAPLPRTLLISRLFALRETPEYFPPNVSRGSVRRCDVRREMGCP